MAEDASVRVWDVPAGAEDRRFADAGLADEDRRPGGPGAGGGMQVAFARDGRTPMVTNPAGPRPGPPWAAVTRRPPPRPDEPPGRQPVALAPDGRLLAAGGPDGLVRQWRTATGNEVRRFEWHPPPKEEGGAVGVLTAVAFSADGKTLAAGGFPPTEESRAVRVRLWEGATGRERLPVDFLPQPAALPGRARPPGPRR